MSYISIQTTAVFSKYEWNVLNRNIKFYSKVPATCKIFYANQLHRKQSTGLKGTVSHNMTIFFHFKMIFEIFINLHMPSN